MRAARSTTGRRRGRLPEVIASRALLTLMLGHFTVDMYVGVIPVLYPLLVHRFAIGLGTVGFVSLAYSGVASVSQPFFGWLADRYGTRFIGLALIWTASTFSTIGFAASFPTLVALAALAGLGSGMYHPLGAMSARRVIDERQRNTAMSIYVTAGTVGVSLGPLIGALVFSWLGLHGTVVMFVPGICTATWLLFELRRADGRRPIHAVTRRVAAPPVPLLPLIAVIAVMMSRSCTLISIEAFVPTWYKQLGYGPLFYGALATTVILASAVGTVGSGSFADRFGRRAVIMTTLVLTIPCVLLFAQFTGPVAFLTGSLVGLSAASTGPLTLVMAQELMAGRTGMASGLILGLGFVTGAIGVPVTGALADAFGMATAFRLQAVLVLATLVVAALLPSEARLRELRRHSMEARR